MRIALVEDERKLARVLRMGLSGEGYEVDLYTDGACAEQQLAERGNAYDLLILDLHLPNRNGSDICRTLRDSAVSIPIIVLTAHDAIEDRVTLLKIGADDFMSKPFDFQELLARMEALIRRSHQAILRNISFADLTLSSVTRQVQRAGRAIALTPKEFALLHYLLRNVGRAVPRDELVAHIWPKERWMASNVIDVHMKNLREKVDGGYETSIIRTVRGVGFAVAAEVS